MKNFSLVIILTFCSIYSFGQHYQFELLGGPSIVTLRGNSLNNHKSKIGFIAGLGLTLNVNNRSSLNTQLSYEQKGSKGNLEIFTTDNDGNFAGVINYKFISSYNYITLPLLYGYEFGKTIKLKIQGGPYVGYLMNSSIIGDNNDVDDNNEKVKTTDWHNRTDLGISIGLNLYFPIKESLFLKIGVADNIGLIDINKSKYNMEAEKTNSINLLVGLNYRLNKAN
jgi:hypothetical protein